MHNYVAEKAGLKIYQAFTSLLTRRWWQLCVRRQSGKWATVWQVRAPHIFQTGPHLDWIGLW